jgi:exonuclease III
MKITVGTFNLNNLFSRYNFKASIDQKPDAEDGGITLSFSKNNIQVKTFMGRLVGGKKAAATEAIARRIVEVMNADILAVQEVEHIEILRQFNRQHLNNHYAHLALVEGNDQRLIDVGLLSKWPLGAITSHQAAVHPEDDQRRVFSRDLLQVEILNHKREKMLTIYNTHLKSHYVPFGEDPIRGAEKANARRQRQAEMIAKIIAKQERPDSKYVLTGDMNDPPASPYLKPMLQIENQVLFNALQNPKETRPAKAESPGQGPGPQHTAWTHRYNPPGPTLPEYALYDQIWLSPALANSAGQAYIDRRKNHGGDGSDHDPAWVELEV